MSSSLLPLAPRPARADLPPDERDLQMFQLAEIHGWTHEAIAREAGLTRRRVSQILTAVRQWLARHPADAPELTAEDQRRRYERNLARMRLHDIMLRTVRALDQAPTSLTTSRVNADGSVTRTTRDLPPVDVPLLRTYLRAVTALGKLEDDPLPPPPAPPPLAEQPWMHEKIQEVLTRWQLKSHSYLISDACLAKFAADLTAAFMACAEDLVVARRQAEAALEAADDADWGAEPDAEAADGPEQGADEAAGPEVDVENTAAAAREDDTAAAARESVAADEAPAKVAEESPAAAAPLAEQPPAAAPAREASASQISLPPAADEQAVAGIADDPIAAAALTSIVQIPRKSRPASAARTPEKNDQGNDPMPVVPAGEEYAKPLLIGPLPDDHPAMHPIRPLSLHRSDRSRPRRQRENSGST